MKISKKIFLLLPVFLGGALFFEVPIAQAASLNFLPQSGTYNVNQTFSVNVVVSSPSEAVNAYSGDILYPSDKLTAVSISKSGSIVNIWTTEPSITKGTVHYEGITLNPGYTGASGKVISVTFRAIASGQADLKFRSASVLANDGLGTSVISSSGAASYTIKTEIPEKKPVVPDSKPETISPILSSTTHPDSNLWYSNRVVEIVWTPPAGVTNVAFSTNQNPVGMPTYYHGVFEKAVTKSLSDGIWFTHVRYRNGTGWGPASSYKTQIDGTPPDNFVVKEESGEESPIKDLSFSATDATSGLSKFGVVIDDKNEVTIESNDGFGKYSSEKLPRGEHSLVVKAYDNAGNFAVYNGKFTTSKLEPPVITEYQKELRDQDFLVARGTTYPNTNVEFSLIRQIPIEDGIFGKKVYVVSGTPIIEFARSDNLGNFTFAYNDRLSYGLYKFTARVVLADGGTSESSPLIEIPVVESMFMQIVHLIFTPTALACIAFFGIGFCIFLLVRTHRKYRRLQIEAIIAEHRKVDNVN